MNHGEDYILDTVNEPHKIVTCTRPCNLLQQSSKSDNFYVKCMINLIFLFVMLCAVKCPWHCICFQKLRL